MKKLLIIPCLWYTVAFAQLAPSAVDGKIEALMARMTLEEKIGQLNQYSSDRLATGPVRANSDKYNDIRQGKVGSMLNVKGAKETRMVQELALQSRLKIPLLFGMDVVHGYRVTFPIPLAEAASWDLDAIQLSARIAAKEAAAAGLHWAFAPMVDIARDPRWGRVMEGAGEDPYLGALIAAARVKGLQGKGLGQLDAVMACAKHFAGYGAAIAGRDYNSVDMSERMLWEVYLPPFKAAVDAGAATFMTAFNDLNGVPATANGHLLRNILKTKWQYPGFVVSDHSAVIELINHGVAADKAEAAKAALLAGCDMDMEGHAYIETLKQLVQAGKVPIELIDDAVRRILRIKFELGLFDDPFRFSDENREQRVLNAPEHHQAALKMAEKSVVLLKNSAATLPLTGDLKSIAVIGPLAKSNWDMRGSWSVYWPEDHMTSLYEGLQARVGKATQLLYAKGCGIADTSKKGFAEAVAIAKKADVVIMALGESTDMTGEAKSRAHIEIPGVQEELVNAIKSTGKKVIVLMMSGRPLIFPSTAKNADAILYTWWLGSEAGHAMANVLYGDYNPSGKLPITFPRMEGQIPIYYSHRNTGRPLVEGQNTNYRSKYLDVSNEPAFAFGYGLSYTTFEFSDLRLSQKTMSATDTLTLSCVLKNTGHYTGEEVVQLYIQDPVASIARPVKELKGFKKIKLKPQESKKVTFAIDKEMLSFFDEQLQWKAEPGKFNVLLGNSSDNILLKETFELIN